MLVGLDWIEIELVGVDLGELNWQGKLVDGREIAVKKLSRSSAQGKKEFLSESKLLARVQHRNVVNLLGYCVHAAEKLLVYQYVVNESLDKILFSNCLLPSQSYMQL